MKQIQPPSKCAPSRSARRARSTAPVGRFGLVLAVGVVLPCAGCAPPAVDLFGGETGQAPIAVPATFDDRQWATVLRENVKDGLVDYDHLQSHAEPLERFSALLAVAGPETTPSLFPSRSARLAYYLNAFNAGVLQAVLHEGIPPTMHDVRRRNLETGYRLMIDGRARTLAEVRAAAGKESRGDVRIEFAFCAAASGSPPLQREPFRAAHLAEQLRRVAQEAMDNPRMVNIDHERERLNIALVIRQRRREFLDYYRRQTGVGSPTLSNVLLHLAGSMRRQWLATAVGYHEAVIPFDRSLNRWTRS